MIAAREGLWVRLGRPGDEAALNRVCLLTGDSGHDASALHDDPDALGRIYAAPYLALEPALTLVLGDQQGVCGYALGALDTVEFEARYRGEWLPPLRAAYPAPTGDPAGWTATERCYHLYHHPDATPAEVDTSAGGYPSHLHIDLLPRAQGRGHGGWLLGILFERLRQAGSAGVHLGVGQSNQRAIGFYRKLGFHTLHRAEGCVYMGRHLP